MGEACKHRTYTTNLAARNAARHLGLDPRRNVEKCKACHKWRVVV